MEKRKNFYCFVYGNPEDLNRAIIRNEFSKFGNVIKIFIDTAVTHAQVYLETPEQIKLACSSLNGVRNWRVTRHKDFAYHSADSSFGSSSGSIQKFSGGPTNKVGQHLYTPKLAPSNFSDRSSNSENMDEEACLLAEDYVDAHGRPVEVFEGEHGQLYVNLNHVRRAGFNIFHKESFENATFTRQMDIQEFEAFLFNKAKKYVMDHKKPFDENEILKVFDRVHEKITANPRPGRTFGEGRLINAAANKNFTITANNIQSSPAANERNPRELADNFQPSFSYVTPRPSKTVPAHLSRNISNGVRQYPNSFDNNQNTRTLVDNRRPEQKSDTMFKAHNNASEEPEESWEENGTTKQQPKVLPNTSFSNRKGNLSVERTLLNPSETYKIKVSFVHPGKDTIFFGQNFTDQNTIDEILLHVNTADLTLPEIVAPSRDTLCIAYFEDCWYRAVVLQGKRVDGCVSVELIDYGNVIITSTPLREISGAMKTIPAMGIRCTIHNSNSVDRNKFSLTVGQEVEVVVKKHYDDKTHVVEIKNDLDNPKLRSAPTTESRATSDVEAQGKGKIVVMMSEIPPSRATLINEEKVAIVNYTDQKLMLRNRETASYCKNLYAYLKNMEKEPVANPKVGQVVLFRRDVSEDYHRVEIKKVQGQLVEIQFVDTCAGEMVDLNLLRNIDKTAAAFPIAKVDSPEIDWLKTMSEDSVSFLNNLLITKTKLKVVLNGSKFDLLLPDDDKSVLLSKKIKDLDNPPKEETVPSTSSRKSKEASVESKQEVVATQNKTVEAPVAQQPPKAEAAVFDSDKYAKITFDDMPYCTAELGEGLYMCYSCCKDGTVTIVSTEDAHKYISDVMVEPEDTEPYEPETFEMCMGLFEGIWYRAVLYDSGPETHNVLFVDFGNREDIPKSDVRRFPKQLKDIPILGIGAYFMGLPNVERIYNRLQELVNEQMVTVNVKENIGEDLRYGIEIPSVYATLKEENLI